MADPQFEVKKMITSFLPMIVIFGLQALKLDYQDPTIIWSFRGIYASSLIIYLAVCAIIYLNINKNKEALSKKLYYAKKFSPIEKQTEQSNYDALTVEQKKTASPPGDYYMHEETIEEFDKDKLKQMVTSTLQGTLFTVGIHWYWGFIPPLAIQGFSMLIRLFELQLVQIHILGKTDVARPFREEAGFLDKLQGKDPVAEIEAFEREQKKKLKKKD